MDDYKKYENNGEIVYPGIFDSLQVIPGKNRALITGVLLSDPKVTKYRIFWNGGLDSVEAPLVRTGGIDTMKQIVDNLPEGPITFEIRTYDKDDNKSVPMNVTGIIYGDAFQTSINQRGNRAILQSSLTLDGAIQLTWADVESYVGVVGMHIQYYDVNDVLKDTVVPVQLQDQTTDLPDANISKPVTYNTLFIPDAIGIDTLTVNSASAPMVSEVSLLNNIHPVKVSESDGNRWANLLDWISNDAIKSHNGYGGSDISGGSDYKIFFEAGYGAPEIANGKIYQIAKLPPGKYTFDGSIDWWNNGGQNYTYLVVAPGADGLPDTDNLSTAIGYQLVNNGSDVQVSFELTQQTTISLGCVVNLGTSGNSMRFNSLRLYINQ
ncbi:hypothetical protein A9P82_02895 [Arachidicoccus ginsenosidimutans]|uniref:DUF4998 domain-containing protein n=1 Tax=Arachidicoccus sp. BS20 TaxID=1850526 RepID=UPI0007F164A6|nr:DUF4998 domain-containing protein [Arachidicoccus sp. BS20]ANI88334.1 hypothetical protein A9P82_02860 [Arachidicoccus sp. BS20]ANI88340.1 hypothetical protein A9P82_02895 [Arachidicoccus sp. BS20]